MSRQNKNVRILAIRKWGETVLELKNVHAGYGKLKILRGIDMKVERGSIVALLGGNGTGKSTLLKTVSGLLPLMEGSMTFDGVDIGALKPHERMRLGLVQVTQSKEAYPAMTCLLYTSPSPRDLSTSRMPSSA